MIQATNDIPQNLEAERAILGKLLEDNSILSEVAILKSVDFFTESHQHIFKAILEMDSFDVITVADKLKARGKLEDIGGIGYLAELEAEAPMQGNFEFYAKMIKDDSLLRELISGCNIITKGCKDPGKNVQSVLVDAEKLLTELSQQSIIKSSVQIKDSITEYFIDLEKRSESKSSVVGLPTGIYKLDQMLSGLISPDLITIAGASGSGKTALALNMLTEAAKKGPVKIFSREMSHKQLSGRLLSSVGKINNRALKTGNLNQEQWGRLSSAAGELSDIKFSIDDKTSSINEAVHKTKQEYNKNGLVLAAFDYAQLFESEGQNREKEVANISGKLKTLAMDLDIPIILLSQLNRKVDERKEHEPQLSDLRESGALEHDSDIVLLINRPDKYEKDIKKHTGIVDIIIAKHRNGPTGMIKAGFEGKFTKFYNIA